MINLLHTSVEHDSKDFIKRPFYKLEQLIVQIRNPNVWGHWICIAAFANIIGVKIILIHPGQTHGQRSEFIIDEFIPYNNIFTDKVFFMTFLEPHYYHVTKYRFDPSDHIIEMRENFISSCIDRKRLRKQAIDTIGKGQAAKTLAIKKPEHETITPMNRRFDVTPTPQINSNFTTRNQRFRVHGFKNNSDSSSYSNSNNSNDGNDRFIVKKLFDDSINNQTPLKSMFKMKKHIQQTFENFETFQKFKNFQQYQDEHDSDSSFSNQV